jgi:hypothetical protein
MKHRCKWMISPIDRRRKIPIIEKIEEKEN